MAADTWCRIGDLRLRLPKPIEHYKGTINATQVGPQCIQYIPPLRQDMPAEMLQDVVAALGISVDSRPQSEDCTLLAEIWMVSAWLRLTIRPQASI